MGTGVFDNDTGKFNFVITAPHAWDLNEKTLWQARFIEASRMLYEASEGQLSFGNIYMADDNWGLGQAEFVVHDVDSTAYAFRGGYGRAGLSVQLFTDQLDGDPRTIVHEFGHHAFALGDEYTGPVQSDEIDTEATLDVDPDNPFYATVPLLPSENDSQSLYSGFAILRFGGRVERLIVREHTPTAVTVYNAFSQDPRQADGGRIYYQPQYNYTHPEFPLGIIIGCHPPGDQNANYCLMERYDAGTSTLGVAEFCSADNHDHDHDTAHDAIYGGRSCWEVIQQVMQEEHGFPITAPNPALPGQQTDSYPLFHNLAKEVRIALVMDRSGSMADDGKIQGARFGVEQWLSTAHVDNDWLSVIWYNQAVDPRLSLTQVDQDDVEALITETNNDTDPGGWTNIRDALYAAVDQIQSRDEAHGRAATQAIVLLTDGVHNWPEGTVMNEVIPTLREAGLPVFVIALGTQENLDFEALEALARDTGGMIDPFGFLAAAPSPEDQPAIIGIHIAQMNFVLRSGLIQVDGQVVGSPPKDSEYAKAMAKSPGKRVPLAEIAKLQGVDGIAGLLKTHQHQFSFAQPFFVEAGAEKIRFAITFAEKEKFQLYLVDPDGVPVDFESSADAELLAPNRPYATAIVRKPKPGPWYAVMVRASPGQAARVNYAVGVDNRMLVVHADCDREVPVGMPTRLTAGAVWGDRLSGLGVSARIIGPDGGSHTVILNDATAEEPSSGEYGGLFVPEAAGRYTGEVRFVHRGGALNVGGNHRALHAPRKEKEALQIDLNTKAPPFIRRIPIYFDAGKRRAPKDIDQPRRGKGGRAPARPRHTKLTPLDIGEALKHVRKTHIETKG